MKTIFKKIITYILQIESRLVLYKYKPKIIAITGSLGKTSTKDAVYAVLSKISYVRKSEKSFNSEIGLPLTILGCRNGWDNPLLWFSNILKGVWLFVWPHKYPKWLVLEVGVGKPGDMRKTASWLKTDAVIITTIGDTPPHIEFFSSHKHLVEEKSQLIKTLKKDGLLVLNSDDNIVLEMKSKTKCRVITYGFKPGADVLGSDDNILYNEKNEPEGIVFRANEGGSSMPVNIEGVFGRNHIYAALGAIALSFGLKFNMISVIGSLKNYEVPPARMRLLKGIKGTMIIDDTYNSSPFASESALRTLKEIKWGKRKVAVLGDMLELGKHTYDAHKNIGGIAGSLLDGNEDALIIVGPRAKSIKEGALSVNMKKENIFEFDDSYQAGDFMKNFVKDEDLILVKGSQGMRMERVVEKILLNQEEKEKNLVRQDDEWKNKK